MITMNMISRIIIPTSLSRGPCDDRWEDYAAAKIPTFYPPPTLQAEDIQIVYTCICICTYMYLYCVYVNNICTYTDFLSTTNTAWDFQILPMQHKNLPQITSCGACDKYQVCHKCKLKYATQKQIPPTTLAGETQIIQCMTDLKNWCCIVFLALHKFMLACLFSCCFYNNINVFPVLLLEFKELRCSRDKTFPAPLKLKIVENSGN